MERNVGHIPPASLSLNDKIAVIGSGNVATAFAHALDSHADIVQVYSRDIAHARNLASTLTNPDCQAIDSPWRLRTDCTLYIIAVSDDAIADIVSQIPEGIEGTVVHTSGSTPVDILAGVSPNYGSLYPLQTISAGRLPDPTAITMLVEGSNPATERLLDACASLINPSKPAIKATSAQRMVLHVAAVFACNFCNYLWGCSAEIIHEAGLDPHLIEPLIRATVDKALNAPDDNPHHVQTGPAMRGDLEVISRHIDMLPPRLSEIYRTLSQSIIDHHSKKRK